MKKFIIGAVFIAIGVLAYAFIPFEKIAIAPRQAGEEEIKWYTWEEAIQLSEKNPKKIFVDVYTEWCGWCKKMDATTFKDPAVVKFMNENFYAVKFDAEQRESIQYNGYTLKYIPSGNRGIHELAYSLLDGRLSYPSYVYLDEKQARITISPGYKQVDGMMKELKYIGEDHYKNKSFDEFLSSSGK